MSVDLKTVACYDHNQADRSSWRKKSDQTIRMSKFLESSQVLILYLEIDWVTKRDRRCLIAKVSFPTRTPCQIHTYQRKAVCMV